MRKWKYQKDIRRMNKVSYLFIILFLIMSMQWYMDLGVQENKNIILFLQIFTLVFAIGGIRQLVGIGTDAAISDGIDLPDLS